MASMWAFLTTWPFTPTSLFIILNLTILTIVLISHLGSHSKPQFGQDYYAPGQLVRPPSLLDRVKSVYFSLYRVEQHHPEPEYPDPNPFPDLSYHGQLQQLTRTPSFLERLKSINLSPYKLEQPHLEPEYPNHNHYPDLSYPAQPQQLTRTPSFLERSFKYISFSPYNPEQPHPEPEYPNSNPSPDLSYPGQPQHQHQQLTRTPSLLERLKSIKGNLPSLYRSDSSSASPETEAPELESKTVDTDPNRCNDHLVKWSKSDKGVGATKKPKEEITKSASEKSHAEEEIAEHQRSEAADNEEVDAKADDFINRFKQQLRLERLNSILRYRKQ